MSLESDIGRATRDIMESVTDAVVTNVTVVMKREMNLTDEQVMKVASVIRSTVESVAFIGMSQYVSIFNNHQKTGTTSKKLGIFG